MCARLGLYSRHNHLRNTLAALLRSFGFSAQLEALPRDLHSRPADVLVCGVSDTPDAVDTTFVHILHPTLSLAGLDATKLLQQREREKRRQNQASCRLMSWNPVPFAVTTMGQWALKAKRFVGRVIRLRALQTKEAFADVAQEVWGAITEAVVFAVARQLDRGFPVEQPSVINPPGDEHDEQPFRVFVRLAAEFSALADAPEQQDGVEAQAECPHPSSSVERDDNADEGSMDVDIAQEGVQTPLGGCTSPDPDFEELVETNDPTWNDDEEDDLPTWNDSGGRQQGPRTLVWEDPEGGSRVWSR
jgi:hypothetical protein